MFKTPEPTRLQLALREETWTVPGLTTLPWTTGSRPAKKAPSAQPECSCPVDCLRDHENE